MNKRKVHKIVGNLIHIRDKSNNVYYEKWPGKQLEEEIHYQALSTSSHLLNTYYVLSTVWAISICFYTPSNLWGSHHYHPHFIDEEIGEQSGEVNDEPAWLQSLCS